MSASTDQWRVNVNDGKYTVRFTENSKLLAERYGEEWRECIGDNLVYWLAVELKDTREALLKAIAMAENGATPAEWEAIEAAAKGVFK